MYGFVGAYGELYSESGGEENVLSVELKVGETVTYYATVYGWQSGDMGIELENPS